MCRRCKYSVKNGGKRFKTRCVRFLTTAIGDIGTYIYFGNTTDNPYNIDEWNKFNQFLKNVKINGSIFRNVLLFMLTNDASAYTNEWGDETIEPLTAEESRKLKRI